MFVCREIKAHYQLFMSQFGKFIGHKIFIIFVFVCREIKAHYQLFLSQFGKFIGHKIFIIFMFVCREIKAHYQLFLSQFGKFIGHKIFIIFPEYEMNECRNMYNFEITSVSQMHSYRCRISKCIIEVTDHTNFCSTKRT